MLSPLRSAQQFFRNLTNAGFPIEYEVDARDGCIRGVQDALPDVAEKPKKNRRSSLSDLNSDKIRFLREQHQSASNQSARTNPHQSVGSPNPRASTAQAPHHQAAKCAIGPTDWDNLPTVHQGPVKTRSQDLGTSALQGKDRRSSALADQGKDKHSSALVVGQNAAKEQRRPSERDIITPNPFDYPKLTNMNRLKGGLKKRVQSIYFASRADAADAAADNGVRRN